MPLFLNRVTAESLRQDDNIKSFLCLSLLIPIRGPDGTKQAVVIVGRENHQLTQTIYLLLKVRAPKPYARAWEGGSKEVGDQIRRFGYQVDAPPVDRPTN